jgi:MFS family permease
MVGLRAAAMLLPETGRVVSRAVRNSSHTDPGQSALQQSSPCPVRAFAALLLLDFIAAFAIALIQPVLVFYVYRELGHSTIQYGLVIGVYGLANVLGQVVLSGLSGRIGRVPFTRVPAVERVYLGLSQVTQFGLLLLVAVVAGLGSALIAPALGSLYLDIAADQLRSQIIGIKASAMALASVLGPLLVVLALQVRTSLGIFIAAGALTMIGAVMAVVTPRGLRSPTLLRSM